jgi:hypothetical protein
MLEKQFKLKTHRFFSFKIWLFLCLFFGLANFAYPTDALLSEAQVNGLTSSDFNNTLKTISDQ